MTSFRCGDASVDRMVIRFEKKKRRTLAALRIVFRLETCIIIPNPEHDCLLTSGAGPLLAHSPGKLMDLMSPEKAVYMELVSLSSRTSRILRIHGFVNIRLYSQRLWAF